MKLILFAASTLLAASAFAARVDLKESKVTWKGSKLIGSTHTGHIQLKSAKVKYKDKTPVSADIVIDMTTITNTDVESPKFRKKLVDHLNSDDFFSTKKHKTARFEVTQIQKASDKIYLLIGKLYIKGKGLPMKVKANVVKNTGKTQVVKADLKFDRTKYGIKFNSGSIFQGLGDKMISDEVEVSVELSIKNI